MTDTLIEAQEDILLSAKQFFQSPEGALIVEQFIAENENKYLTRLKSDRKLEIANDIESRQKESEQINARVSELKLKQSELANIVAREIEEHKKGKHLEQYHLEADKKLEQKNIDLKRLDEKIDETLKLYNVVKELDSINKKRDEAQNEYSAVFNMKFSLNKEIESLKQDLNNSDDELRNKLLKIKPFVETINGSFSHNIQAKDADILIKINPLSYSAEIEGQRAVISAVSLALNSKDRKMADWEIANLLILTQQSFITILAGLPGTGKTSLSKIFAESQGLEKRLKEVSVARGWTSIKDLVGFFNPLSSRFQPSSTGLYSFLKTLSDENNQVNEIGMSYILLDEANLSPIEHYWSVFMAMADEDSNKDLILGQENINIPASLRFIATINYDGTTEPLSARIIDRAPIIVMKSKYYDDNQLINNASNALHQMPISSNVMHNLFGRSEKSAFEESEERVLKKILTILEVSDADKGRPIFISHRKKNAIRHYCEKARGIMREEADLLALDLAVTQFILPHITGHGDKFGKRLQELHKHLVSEELLISANYLEEIMYVGLNELHSYDFFCW